MRKGASAVSSVPANNVESHKGRSESKIGCLRDEKIAQFTLNSILIPRFMKGLVKSITLSRAKFIVIEPTAKSAFCIDASPAEGMCNKKRICFCIEVKHTSPQCEVGQRYCHTTEYAKIVVHWLLAYVRTM